MKPHVSAITLNHDSYITLHVQLHNALRQLIVSGRWEAGSRIPGELQLARHLKISRSTVRIALQKAELEGLITRVAGKGTFVSYKPPESDTTRFVGYVTRSFHNEIHRVLLSSVETALRAANCNVIFSNASDIEAETQVLGSLLNDGITGLVLWANAQDTQEQHAVLSAYLERDIPVVFIDRFVGDIAADFVSSDNFGATRGLVEHLLELGHRNIVFLQHNINNLHPVDERRRGYEAALVGQGLTPHPPWKINSPQQSAFFETDIFHLLEDADAELGGQIAQYLEQATPRPTAIVCVNDALAILTIRAVQARGLRVPEDISVVGFDDISLAAYMGVPLTTASQDAHAIGTAAARLLLERLDGHRGPPRHHTVPTKLQIRMSTSTPIVEQDLTIEDEERLSSDASVSE